MLQIVRYTRSLCKLNSIIKSLLFTGLYGIWQDLGYGPGSVRPDICVAQAYHAISYQFCLLQDAQSFGIFSFREMSTLPTRLLILKELLDVRPNFDRIRPNIFVQITVHFDQQIFSLEHCGSQVVGTDTGLDSNRTNSSAPVSLSSIKTHSVGLCSQQKRPTYAGTRIY